MRGTTSQRRSGHQLGHDSGSRPAGRWLVGLGAVAASLWVQSEARADLHLAIGSRIEPLRYTSAYLPNSAASTFRPSGSTGGGAESLQSTSLSPYIALYFAQKYGIMLSLDIGYAKSTGEVQAMGMAMPTTDNNSYFQFGVGIGTKIYFTPPRSQKIAPYIYLDVFKYFASISTDNMGVSGEYAGAQASLRSPTGGTLAVGAEYFLSPGFSIGSEIFGLRVSGVTSDYKDAAMTRHSSSYTQVTLYTGITLNYRFQISSSVRAVEEESAAEPGRKRRQQTSEEFLATPPPPQQPPPPSPEAVD